MSGDGLLLRAIVAFLALPGVVAFLVPWLLADRERMVLPFAPLGVILIAGGSGLLVWCVRDFYVVGKGTLAPWSPPRELVVVGLYRVSRNPMYGAVALVLWGWAVGLRSRSHTVYAVAMMVAFHLRVVLFEEPWLARQHGESWRRYRARVPCWIGWWR